MLTSILNFLNIVGLLIIAILPRNNFDFFYNERPIGIIIMVVGILIGLASSLISSFKGNKGKLVFSAIQVVAFPVLVGIKVFLLIFKEV